MKTGISLLIFIAAVACQRNKTVKIEMHSSIGQVLGGAECYANRNSSFAFDSCSLVKMELPSERFLLKSKITYSLNELCFSLYADDSSKSTVSIYKKKHNYYDSTVSSELTWIAQSAISTSVKNGYNPLLIDSFRNESHVKVGVFCYKSVFSNSSTYIIGNYTFQTLDSISTTIEISLQVKDEKVGFETVKCALRSIKFL